MILAGHSNQLAFFNTNRWKLYQIVTLPEYILSVHNLEFVPLSFDSGSNRTLAILSGQGVVYFYDVEESILMSELASKSAIVRFDCAEKGSYFACCLCTGEVEVYNVNPYIILPVKINAQRAVTKDGKIKLRKCCSKIGLVKREVKVVVVILFEHLFAFLFSVMK